MRSMVQAKVEPFYSAFLELKNSSRANPYQGTPQRGTQIREGAFNGTVGIDGRKAHDMAILWHITGDEAYAKKTVEFLNANSYYTNTSSRGTGPLDNGKIYLLISAAELMRDYPGWLPEDQQRFKDMLVYPGYSTTTVAKGDSDDDKNNITFYWNIYNFDSMRFGNQGLFAARALMAMGIYLDNELMYDRAYNYLMCLPRNPADEIKYPLGRPIWTQMKIPSASSEYKNDYEAPTTFGKSEYYYDEPLMFYIYKNGQSQESSRDQGHAVGGIHMYGDIAEMSWNNGDNMYGALDNRILKGFNFVARYNLSDWEPSGYTDNEDEVTFENNMYLQRLSRSTPWESQKPSPENRGDPADNCGTREQALAHYSVRAGLDPQEYEWLEKYRDYMIAKFGCERSGKEPNWYYEHGGWGTLTKRRTVWMAGDPVSYASGQRVSGQHQLPGVISLADYDYYCMGADAEGHTYHNLGDVTGNEYRPDGTVEIIKSDDKWVVTENKTGEWYSYTVGAPLTDTYDVIITYRSAAPAEVSVQVDGGEKVVAVFPASEEWATGVINKVHFPGGACVMRVGIEHEGEGLELAEADIQLNSDKEPAAILTGTVNSVDCFFTVSWTYEGFLANSGSLYRSLTPDFADAELISENNAMASYIDKDVNGSMKQVYYFVKASDSQREIVSGPLLMEWGCFNDTIGESNNRWFVVNGSDYYRDDDHWVSDFDSKDRVWFKRDQTFAFHAGIYPILAFKLKKSASTSLSLNNNALVFSGKADNPTGMIGDDIYYYDLSADGFRDSRNILRVSFPEDNYTHVNPLQLRLTDTSPERTPVEFYWAKTFKSVEDLMGYTSGVDDITIDRSDEIEMFIDGKMIKAMPSSKIIVYDIAGRIIVEGIGSVKVDYDGVAIVTVWNGVSSKTRKCVFR